MYFVVLYLVFEMYSGLGLMPSLVIATIIGFEPIKFSGKQVIFKASKTLFFKQKLSTRIIKSEV